MTKHEFRMGFLHTFLPVLDTAVKPSPTMGRKLSVSAAPHCPRPIMRPVCSHRDRRSRTRLGDGAPGSHSNPLGDNTQPNLL